VYEKDRLREVLGKIIEEEDLPRLGGDIGEYLTHNGFIICITKCF